MKKGSKCMHSKLRTAYVFACQNMQQFHLVKKQRHSISNFLLKKKINPLFKSPNAKSKCFLQKSHKKHRKNVREPYYADIQTRNKPGQPVQASRKSQNQNF